MRGRYLKQVPPLLYLSLLSNNAHLFKGETILYPWDEQYSSVREHYLGKCRLLLYLTLALSLKERVLLLFNG